MKWQTASEGDVGTYTVTVTATSNGLTESTSYTVNILTQFCASLTAPAHDASKSYTVNDAEDQLEIGAFTESLPGCLFTYATTVSPAAAFMT